jgi:hypothetical protein
MNMGLLLPGALLALATLILPVLLHLARRNQQPPLEFAALRWLARKPRPRRRLRLHDIPLLLLRLLLLAVLAVWLAQPVLYGSANRQPYVAVMPGLARTTVQQQPLPANARTHWLAVGFPTLDHAAPASAQPISSLLRQLDAELPTGTPLIVLATARFDGADAQVPVLSRPVDWRIVAETAAPPIPPASATPAPPLWVMASTHYHPQAQYLLAAARAWPATAQLLPVSSNMPARTHLVLAWWSDAPLPPALLDWVKRGGTAVLPASQAMPASVASQKVTLWQRDNGEVLLEAAAVGRGRLLHFSQALRPDVMPELLEARFPQQLRDALQAPPMQASRADAHLFVPQIGATPYPTAPRPLQPWLALLAACLFACERIWASGKRGVASQ